MTQVIPLSLSMSFLVKMLLIDQVVQGNRNWMARDYEMEPGKVHG